MDVEEVRKRKGEAEVAITDKKKIEEITDEIINQIDNVRTNLSDEFYPDNLHTLEVLKEKIEEILIKHL